MATPAKAATAATAALVTDITVAVKAGENDKLYGSVTAQDIASALEAEGITVDKKKIELSEPIHQLGVYNVQVKLHPEVSATLKVWVVKE